MSCILEAWLSCCKINALPVSFTSALVEFSHLYKLIWPSLLGARASCSHFTTSEPNPLKEGNENSSPLERSKEGVNLQAWPFPFATFLFVIDQFPFTIFHLRLSMENER